MGHDAEIGLRSKRCGELATCDPEVQIEDIKAGDESTIRKLGTEVRRPPFQEQTAIDLIADDDASIELKTVLGVVDDMAMLVELEP